MEQLEPKEHQPPESEQETTTNIPEPEGAALLGESDIPPDWGSEPPCPCPCPCPCEEE